MAEREESGLTSRKVRDRSIALLLIGFAFFMPPLASVSSIDIRIAGIPFTVLFLFAAWALLIVGALLLARPLLKTDEALSIDTHSDHRR